VGKNKLYVRGIMQPKPRESKKKKSERSRINKYSQGPFSELWAEFIFCGAELFPRGETEREKYKLMSSYTG